MPSQLLKNKTIIVTGGNSGIGFAISQKIIDHGGIAIIIGKNQIGLKKTHKQLGKNAIIWLQLHKRA